MALVLPKKPTPAVSHNAASMIIYGLPKAGKSSFCSKLPNHLILDLENGYKNIEATKLVMVNNSTFMDEIKELILALREEKKETGANPYRFIVIDNASRLGDRMEKYILDKYQASDKGKDWGWLKKDGLVVKDQAGNKVRDPKINSSDIPFGGGVVILREAICTLLQQLGEYCETVILVCHATEKSINVDGIDTKHQVIDLSGKSADKIAGMVDAIGWLYRAVDGKTMLSFKSGDNICRGARPDHLRNREFPVITCDDENQLHIDISKIFI